MKLSNNKQCDYLRKPTFQLQEEKLLTETENLFSGLWRSLHIFVECMRGFYRFRDIGNCITVFGSARFHETHPYYQTGREMGQLLARAGFTAMTGGGPGIMEAVNRGAKEAGGLSVSCNIQLLGAKFERPNRYVDKRITMHYLFVRKFMLTKYSLAFIALPGGFGTLDEFFELATLIQTGKIRNFPLILMCRDYWQPLIDFLKGRLIKSGAVEERDIDRLLITDSPEEALTFIKKAIGTY